MPRPHSLDRHRPLREPLVLRSLSFAALFGCLAFPNFASAESAAEARGEKPAADSNTETQVGAAGASKEQASEPPEGESATDLEDEEDEDDDDLPSASRFQDDDRDPELDRLGSGPELPEPKASDQPLGSVEETAPLAAIRSAEFGPVFGVTFRSADSSAMSYAPGFTWGASLRSDVWSFISARISYINSTHQVEGDPKVADIASGAEQAASVDEVSSFSFRFSVEPTWVYQDLRVFGILGVGWGRFKSEYVEDASGFHLASARSGVFLEYPLGIGLSYEVVPHWLSVGLNYTFSLHTRMTGKYYENFRGVTHDGQRLSIQGLPQLNHSQTLGLQLSAIL